MGEGYGATLAGLIMADDMEGLFNCGTLVNPVTDWMHTGEFSQKSGRCTFVEWIC